MLVKEEADLAQVFLPPRAVKFEKRSHATVAIVVNLFANSCSRIYQNECVSYTAGGTGLPQASPLIYLFLFDSCVGARCGLPSALSLSPRAMKEEQRRRWLTFI